MILSSTTRQLRWSSSAILVAAVLSTFTACTLAGSTADYPSYASIEDVASSADVVAHVAYVSQHDDVLYPEIETRGSPKVNPQAGLSEQEAQAAREAGAVRITVTLVRVLEVLKGDHIAPGQEIAISQPGTSHQPSSEVRYLADIEADSLVVMLRAWESYPYDLLNPEQAVYLVSEDGQTRSLSDSPAFIVKTYDELRTAIHRAAS